MTDTEYIVGRRDLEKRDTETVTSHADVNHVTSIIVTRVSTEGAQNVTVATVSSFEPASAKVDGDKLKVTGTTEPSTTSGEKGYLELTWTHPLQDQAGVYVCEVFALNSNLHPEALSVSVKVDIEDATIPDLIHYISENDRKIENLQNQIDEFKFKIGFLDNDAQSLTDQYKVKFDAIATDIANLKMAANNLTNQNIQMGNITCHSSNSDVSVKFDTPYVSTPTVFIAINELSGSVYNSYSFSPYVSKLERAEFILRCSSSSNGFGVSWIALDIDNDITILN
ncbi:uncharacterized protein LOC131945088 [Physella acuta]|uniref:uncharacterized protein LOC131945088 n=1 Tax=Physella acuta TaxID=109671 RepID=UPI0027DB5A57|nr:uncharacterized protein LOC131945088 [Physella acuta]